MDAASHPQPGSQGTLHLRPQRDAPSPGGGSRRGGPPSPRPPGGLPHGTPAQVWQRRWRSAGSCARRVARSGDTRSRRWRFGPDAWRRSISGGTGWTGGRGRHRLTRGRQATAAQTARGGAGRDRGGRSFHFRGGSAHALTEQVSKVGHRGRRRESPLRGRARVARKTAGQELARAGKRQPRAEMWGEGDRRGLTSLSRSR